MRYSLKKAALLALFYVSVPVCCGAGAWTILYQWWGLSNWLAVPAALLMGVVGRLTSVSLVDDYHQAVYGSSAPGPDESF